MAEKNTLQVQVNSLNSQFRIMELETKSMVHETEVYLIKIFYLISKKQFVLKKCYD